MQYDAMQHDIVRCNIHSLGVVQCTIESLTIVSFCERCVKKYDIVCVPTLNYSHKEIHHDHTLLDYQARRRNASRSLHYVRDAGHRTTRIRSHKQRRQLLQCFALQTYRFNRATLFRLNSTGRASGHHFLI
jgi:hypothetical protein